MERSSPLAALHPGTGLGLFDRYHDTSDFSSNFLRPCAWESRSFRAHDYFSRPVRGSSPTASLAVDLSQNFHIDKSPQMPTPRRALFTSSNPAGYDRQQGTLTPPIPSSSPRLSSDVMDVSPLPHKQPPQIVIPPHSFLPTPEPTPVLDQNQPTFEAFAEAAAKLSPPRQRKLPACVRPSLRKGYSSSSIAQRPASNPELPFIFGLNSSRTSLNIMESFAESPPSERKPASSSSTASLLNVAIPKLVFPADGSPSAGVRRPSSSRSGVRAGLGRRTQSLQCTNPLRLRQEKRCCTTGSLQPTIYDDDMLKPKLPHFKPEGEPDSLPRITQETLISLLDGGFSDELDGATIIDCRFEYEFSGGHIEGAINYNDKDMLAEHLFRFPSSSKKALVFHCEYSAHRAPLMAQHIRRRDREVNKEHYPRLTYPDIYILDGGYSSFFKNHRTLCFPQNYVEMESKEHESACEMGMAKVKRRGKLHRAQTYAFGQSMSSTYMATAPLPQVLAATPSDFESMDVDFSRPIAFHRLPVRRFDSR